MTREEKIEFLHTAFKDLFKKDLPELEDDMDITVLGLDSLDIVELQLEFEKAFDVELPDPEHELKTVGDLLNHLKF